MTNVRTLRDANLTVSKALPAAAASNQSSSIDTAETNPGRLECVEWLIELPVTPALVDAKTITLTLAHSDDDSSFTTNTDVPAQVTTGAGGNGGPAISYQFKLPITCKRYIALGQAVLAAGGSNIA